MNLSQNINSFYILYKYILSYLSEIELSTSFHCHVQHFCCGLMGIDLIYL
jgi:hypothetical protein